MLQAIRDKTTGWIAYAIIFLISVPFALWGVNSYLGGGEAVAAATVNGQDISVRDFDTAYANYRQRLSRAFGGTIPVAFGDETLLKSQVLTQLIEDFALRQYVVEQGYRIGDEQLGKLIRAEQVFQTDGRFDQSIYAAQLGSLGYSTGGFEQEFRQNQAMEQLQSGINATAFMVPERKKQFASLSSQSRKIRVLTRDMDAEKYGVDEAEIEAYYQANTIRYMSPEQVKIDFLELNLESIKSLIEIEDEQVLDRYEQAKDSYTAAEYRSASHILLTLEEAASNEDSERVRQRLLDLREQIVATGDFASAAREFSQDPGSAADGGNLGELERGVMVQPFEDALFQMQVGELSEPVRTAFGWHLIKLDQLSGGETRSLEEVRPEIEDEIKAEIAENQIYDILENLSNLAYEQPDSLSPAAEQLGLTLQTSDWFDRNSGTGVALEPRVRSVAFSNQVLREGINSEAIELADNRILFVRLNTYQPAEQLPLEAVKQVIVSELKAQKARNNNARFGKEALETLRGGESLDQIASKWDLVVVDRGFVERSNTEIDRELLQMVFAMDKPAAGMIFEGLPRSDGSYSLVELSGVVSSDSEIDNEPVEALATAAARVEYLSVLKALTSNAEVIKTPLSELE